jgi:hypothetical protein
MTRPGEGALADCEGPDTTVCDNGSCCATRAVTGAQVIGQVRGMSGAFQVLNPLAESEN